MAFAGAVVVLVAAVGARAALSGGETRSHWATPTAHLASGPTLTRFVQSSSGSYRVSGDVVTVPAVATPTPAGINP